MTKIDEHIVADPAAIREMPQDRAVRDAIRSAATAAMRDRSRTTPPSREELETAGRAVLRKLDLPDSFLGFCMVSLDNAFWREQFLATPIDRRLLLLPHCLRDSAHCAAPYDDIGLQCAGCGRCAIDSLKADAEKLGYRVIVAEGTPAVIRHVFQGDADGLLGIACLESLDKAFERMNRLGVPHASVPLIKDGCVDTIAELDVIRDWLTMTTAQSAPKTRSYVSLLRAAHDMFLPQSLNSLLTLDTDTDGIGLLSGNLNETETAAVDWLIAGGKRFRPFIALAAVSAVQKGEAALEPDADLSGVITPAAKRIALAIEAMHKASLAHDDIEDDDAVRYDRETLHERYGVPTAINIGDYLVGLGYRLIASAGDDIDSGRVADILSVFSDAHLKLCKGQGAELAERKNPLASRDPKTMQAIYALKTAPAFEAAFFAGLSLAGGIAPYATALKAYSRFLGVAFQIKNDIDEFDLEKASRKTSASPYPALWPTFLQALAVQTGGADAVERIQAIDSAKRPAIETLASIRALYVELGVIDKAEKIISAYRDRAFDYARKVGNDTLCELMLFVADTAL